MEEALLAEVETSSDAERVLVDAAISGDVQAFAALYDRHLQRVYRYVYYWMGNPNDAEDLTQQAFLNAWQAIGRYRHTGASFASWLVRIAHNLVMSFYRKAKETSCPDVETLCTEHWGDPEAEALAKHDRLALRRALFRLKPEQQQVIIMRFVEELRYADIAAAIGKREGHVRVIQHRALADLRHLLSQEVNR